MNEWISVSEKHPSDRTPVLVFCANTGAQYVARYSFGMWWLAFRAGRPLYEDGALPSHWKPLDAPPEVQSRV